MGVVWSRAGKNKALGSFKGTEFSLEFDPDRGLWFLDVGRDRQPDVFNTFKEAMLSVDLVCEQIDNRFVREADAEAKISSLLKEGE